MEKNTMELYNALLQGNKKFVKEMNAKDPDFFSKLANGQAPPTLWIGCSDSRVPANEITDTLPGEIFVHRNIANMVVHTDMNMLSVLDYAVSVLEVQHVIVCGHYGCGGILAAMGTQRFGLIDNWLRHIKDVIRIHSETLHLEPSQELMARKLVELNVQEQVNNLARTSIIQHAWETKGAPWIHGWTYDVADGVIKDLEISCNH